MSDSLALGINGSVNSPNDPRTWASSAHFPDEETEGGRLKPVPTLRSRPGTTSAQLPGRLREGQVACKELSGRQCCGSVRGARRDEALLAAARGTGAGDVKSGEARS